MSKTVVIDFGTENIRIGYAGQDEPSYTCKNFFGSITNPKLPVNEGSQLFFGNSTLDICVHFVQNNYENGCIKGPYFDEIFNYAIENSEISLKDKYVLINDSPVSNDSYRMTILSKLFNKYEVKGVSIQDSAVMALYNTGCTSGVVIDCGASFITATPIINGGVVESERFRDTNAGLKIRKHICKQLLYATDINYSEYEFILSQCCANDTSKDSEDKLDFNFDSGRHMCFYDGSHIPYDVLLGSRAIKYCWNPPPNLPENVANLLKDNVFYCGGVATFDGFKEFVQRGKIMHDPMNAVWIGGSIMASIPGFEKLFITKDEFIEKNIECVKKSLRK